ncbi:adipogenesis regulatory factor isoform 1-T1 [Cyanocitta cristata]
MYLTGCHPTGGSRSQRSEPPLSEKSVLSMSIQASVTRGDGRKVKSGVMEEMLQKHPTEEGAFTTEVLAPPASVSSPESAGYHETPQQSQNLSMVSGAPEGGKNLALHLDVTARLRKQKADYPSQHLQGSCTENPAVETSWEGSWKLSFLTFELHPLYQSPPKESAGLLADV